MDGGGLRTGRQPEPKLTIGKQPNCLKDIAVGRSGCAPDNPTWVGQREFFRGGGEAEVDLPGFRIYRSPVSIGMNLSRKTGTAWPLKPCDPNPLPRPLQSPTISERSSIRN